ncbi:hypothetical protein CFOL_v3_22886 [Cephalotus follicularis]|uniref:DUF4378 domain-containing protein n=1 Tax=Cephalotus follicularis TaxID=3775 RepID=A0A1Q3CH71_CEPFO|nr:hypothetical protein CFOL_v3_22886 [Cephalotus follicularis]
MASQKSKPLMLKDYLRDDLGSCSSDGFKSFPRRKCCTTVRFLLEMDLKTKDSNNKNTKRRLLKRSRSKAAPTTTSAWKRASFAVVNAVKLLPFPSVKPLSPSIQIKGLLPKSLSLKLFKNGFSKKGDHHHDQVESQIKGWKTFHEYLEERDPPSDQNTNHSKSNTTVPVAITNPCKISTRTSSDGNGGSWGDSEFTAYSLHSSRVSSENGAVEGKINGLPENNKVGGEIGIIVTEEDSIQRSIANAKEWPSDEKEQFSPVSVLDCPFEDKEEICSPFQSRLVCIEGTKQKLMRKIRRCECLAQLEPLDLEIRIALSKLEDEVIDQSPMQPFSMSTYNNAMLYKDEEESDTYEKACSLFKFVESKIPLVSFNFNAEILILDFLTEKIEENASSVIGNMELEQGLLKMAEEWINGQPQQLILGWEVVNNRKGYIIDMDKDGRWGKLDQQKEEVTLEVEHDIFNYLVDELLLDVLLVP